jgi:hypothetical protein
MVSQHPAALERFAKLSNTITNTYTHLNRAAINLQAMRARRICRQTPR